MKLEKLILTFFYVGNFKYAPGTVSSLLTAIICFYLVPDNYLLFLFFLICFLGFYTCYSFERRYLEKDPAYIVIDEVAGMMLAILFIPKNFLLYIVAFILFRFFDILKPSFIYKTQNIKYGLGIMLDDIFAGLIVCLLLLKFNL